MGRHRAPSRSRGSGALAPIPIPPQARRWTAERSGSTLAVRPGGRRVAGRVALTAVVGGVVAAVAPLMPDARPAVAPAGQLTLNLAPASPGAPSTAALDRSRAEAVAITTGAGDADRRQGSAQLAALAKATERSGASARPPAAPSATRTRPTATRAAFVPPVTGRITSNFGPRGGSTHYGLDIANRIGTPIRSVGAGTVIDAGPASGFGLWVRVRLTDGTITVYGHINRALVSKGDRVAAGDVIAEVGNRGRSTGPHLHFETLSPDGTRQDPLAWLERRGAGDVTS